MSLVSNKYKSLTQDGRLQFAQNVITAMTGNQLFPVPNPTLASIQQIRTSIIAKGNEIGAAQDALQMKFTEKKALFDQLDVALQQEAAYVQNVSGGDPVKIQSTGFDVREPAGSIGPLLPPQNVRTAFSNSEGEVLADWDAVLGAGSYVVDCATNPNGPWAQVTVTTRSGHTLTGLISGTKYWIRVRAVGASGFGPWSDPAVKMAA